MNDGCARSAAARLGQSLLALLAFGSLACRGRQSALDPKGPQAAELDWLWRVMLFGGSAIFVVVMGFVVAALFARRHPAGELQEHEPRRVKIVAVATALTALTLVALVVVNALVSRSITQVPEGALPIQVVARQWWWEVTYPEQDAPHRSVRTANELHIPVGQPVQITLESRDVIHSFWVPNLHGKLDAIPGRTTRLWLQADEAGTYRGQCAEFCGLQHARMAFLVVAEAPEQFERWRAQQRQSAKPPSEPLVAQGQHVFLSSSCAMCHTVRGTPAMAAAGPDLTHVASRQSLAAGTLRNERGQLGGWILDPQHIKPGAFMPPNELEGEALNALLSFLESLR